MSYVWDVFVSYRREELVANWTQQVLVPLLRAWLPHYHQPAPSVFLDVDEASLPAGTHWPSALRDALLRTRCLLPVLSPDYFNSGWCLAEFHTMLERQNLTGATVLVPIGFSDGDYYSTDAKALDTISLERFNTVRRRSTAPNGLITEVKNICQRLHTRIAGAPAWNGTWPVHTPTAGAPPHVDRPTF